MNISTKIRQITFGIVLLFSLKASAQFTITQQSAPNLVQNVLVGQGVQVSNITSGGDPEQIGLFTGGNSVNLGISNGVLMTTGNAVSQSDPNGIFFIGDPANSGTISSSSDNAIELTDDPDLNAIISSFGASGITNNIAAIEFDFIPSGDSVAFNYVFGSEEYNGFVCSQYFDVFGFFISGPGITGPYANGAANIAIVPGTNLPVSMNTINDGISDGGIYCPPGGLNNGAYFVDNSGSQNFGPYGFTEILTAQATVQCGETYHIKLVLANGFDNSYDSWVFLQAESFTSNIPNIDIANLLPDSAVVEGCTAGNIVFRRDVTTDSLIVPINFAGTATPNLDYTGLPDSLIFPPGVDSLIYTLTPVDDGISEGINGYEDIIISFVLPNDCGLPITVSRTIRIRDPYVLEFVSSDTTLICPSNNVPISSIVSGGYGPYTYSWDYNNLTTSSITVPAPTDSARYILTVRDFLNCNNIPFLDTVNVIMAYDSLQILTQDTTICLGDTINIFPSISFGQFPYTFNWVGIATTDSISVNPNTDSTYIIEVKDYCNVISRDSITIYVPQYDTLFVNVLDTTICQNTEAQLAANATGGNGTYTFEWYGDSGILENTQSLVSVSPNSSQNYICIVTDGCRDKDSVIVRVEIEKCDLLAGNSFSPNGDGKNDYFEVANILSYPENKVTIFNRWGKVIFETNAYKNDWSGGDDITSGTYFYIIENVTDPKKPENNFMKGTFTVFK